MPCPIKPQTPTSIKEEHLEKGCVHWFDNTRNSDTAISSTKARPCVIISQYRASSQRVTVSPITGREHCEETPNGQLKYPCNAPIFQTDNSFLDKDSVVLLDQVYTIKKSDLCEEWYMGNLKDTYEVDKAIIHNYDLYESTFNIYKELFEQLKDMAEIIHTSNYTRT
ncbi:type II toxin-antitoxin system PemK/MazF family toxin [Ruminiclostridium cellulolyticum]|uniref:Transcriptional modulator of MazE/toxin, MazF n=1 Tax=Ruminiclostridium cellulolyticum (strain ATCC 35319 / DSM 5812 / JCM 6584 / H10) TaxID=394503 RepID=B8I8D9_RUMCH|nr:type II toxin-antitoxin system PemK/MazF family toxin [Ruminiclostridium cellulolyticum]ACL77239.1 transcriptional modulator of MazE/toxin, MazF [Ruminiclostridium cellulolyticum H10]